MFFRRFTARAGLFLVLLNPGVVALADSSPEFDGPGEWVEVNPSAGWDPRAGLQVLRIREYLYLMGGRTPRPPSFPPIPGDRDIWGDVWKSEDRGWSWHRILETDGSSVTSFPGQASIPQNS